MKEHLEDILAGGRPMTKLEKEYKDLNERYDLVCKISEERKNRFLRLNEENEKLHNIIKEVREYIGQTNFLEKGYINFMYELEQILKKENKNE